MDKSCETCKNWLGGIYDCCRLNLESECKAGEYEAWTSRRPPCHDDYCELEPTDYRGREA